MSIRDDCFQQSTTLQTYARYAKMHLVWLKEKTRSVWTPLADATSQCINVPNEHPISKTLHERGMPGSFQLAFASLFAFAGYAYLRGRPVAKAFRLYQASKTNAERNLYSRKLGMNLRDKAFPHTFATRKSREILTPLYYVVPSIALLFGLFGVYLVYDNDNFGNKRIAQYREAYFNGMSLEQYEEYCKLRDAEALAKIDAKFSFK